MATDRSWHGRRLCRLQTPIESGMRLRSAQISACLLGCRLAGSAQRATAGSAGELPMQTALLGLPTMLRDRPPLHLLLAVRRPAHSQSVSVDVVTSQQRSRKQRKTIHNKQLFIIVPQPFSTHLPPPGTNDGAEALRVVPAERCIAGSCCG